MAYGFYPDIVAALKAEAGAEDHRGAGGLCRDAAAEIERLLADLEEMDELRVRINALRFNEDERDAAEKWRALRASQQTPPEK